MNRAEHLVFLPRWPEPYARVFSEAALCGCELVINDNVGGSSFGIDLADPMTYIKAEESFWEKIESFIGDLINCENQ